MRLSNLFVKKRIVKPFPIAIDTNSMYSLTKEIRSLKELFGHLNSSLNLSKTSLSIQDYEFKVYSQWGDDGIIQFLINYLEISEKSFVEFGVETYIESNTRFLLVNDNWRGLVMDGAQENISVIKNDEIYWKYNLTARAEFITAENINHCLHESKFVGEIGLLHIDIDGNDYWVWKSLSVVNPVIVIVEYNSLFGSSNPWTICYQKDFLRTKAHYSNLFYGTSLTSICDLATEKGYSFVGCNSNGNNAYFVRNDKLKELKALTPEEGYVQSQFSESRSENGNLTFLRDEQRSNVLKGLEVFNTRENQVQII
jgi:hypothetical protein